MASTTDDDTTKKKNRRDLARTTPPIPCYNVAALPPKLGGDELYDKLRTAVTDPTIKTKLIEKLEIPAKDARSWGSGVARL